LRFWIGWWDPGVALRTGLDLTLNRFLTIEDHLLHLDGTNLFEVAQRFGTPLFVFSRSYIEHNVNRLKQAFETTWQHGPFRLMPSFKACPMLAIRQLLNQFDCGCDVFGMSELEGAIRGGVDPTQISVNGSIKDEHIIRRSITIGARLVLDSPRELEITERIAHDLGRRARVMIRVKPDLGSLNATSDFAPEFQISELTHRIKYGVPRSEVAEMLPALKSSNGILLEGVHVHMGRHSKRLEVWQAWVAATFQEIDKLCEALPGWQPQTLNLGGGFASESDADLDVTYNGDPTPLPLELAQTICQAISSAITARPWQDAPLLLEIEPGRSIHTDAGLHLTTVQNIKHETDGPLISWAEVDTSEVFLDLHGVPEAPPFEYRMVTQADSQATARYDVVGKTCNAEMLLLDAALPPLKGGDVLALLNTGAYIESMTTNFNALPRPGSVLVTKGNAQLIKRHETIEEVFARDLDLTNPD